VSTSQGHGLSFRRVPFTNGVTAVWIVCKSPRTQYYPTDFVSGLAGSTVAFPSWSGWELAKCQPLWSPMMHLPVLRTAAAIRRWRE
jgi:hypothetical protein